MRNRSAANSAASSPPVPARTSRMALRSSASSFGSSSSLTALLELGQPALQRLQLLLGQRPHLGIARLARESARDRRSRPAPCAARRCSRRSASGRCIPSTAWRTRRRGTLGSREGIARARRDAAPPGRAWRRVRLCVVTRFVSSSPSQPEQPPQPVRHRLGGVARRRAPELAQHLRGRVQQAVDEQPRRRLGVEPAALAPDACCRSASKCARNATTAGTAPRSALGAGESRRARPRAMRQASAAAASARRLARHRRALEIGESHRGRRRRAR